MDSVARSAAPESDHFDVPDEEGETYPSSWNAHEDPFVVVVFLTVRK